MGLGWRALGVLWIFSGLESPYSFGKGRVWAGEPGIITRFFFMEPAWPIELLKHLSFLHVRYPYLYLQVHLLDQVKRAASLSVYLSLVAELCSSIPQVFELGESRRFRDNLYLLAAAHDTALRLGGGRQKDADRRIWWWRSALGRISEGYSSWMGTWPGGLSIEAVPRAVEGMVSSLRRSWRTGGTAGGWALERKGTDHSP